MNDPHTAPSGAEFIPLSQDDRIWFKKINVSELEELFAGPHHWVATKVEIPGMTAGTVRPAELATHFTILFETFQVVGDPSLTVHGIDRTGLITVRLKLPQGVEEIEGLPLNFPVDQKVFIRTSDQRVYSHLELVGLDPLGVAAYIMNFAVNPSGFYTQYNALPQVINGSAVPDDQKKKFRSIGGRPVQVVLEGTVLPPPPPPPPPACNVDLGIDAGGGNVDVETFIVKAYK